MSRRPEADPTSVLAMLRERFAGDATEVHPLDGGEFSRAFAFIAHDQPYVIRLNPSPHAAEAFAKDDYASRRFASPALPIPRVVATGQADGYHFAISDRATGRRLEELSPIERQVALPGLLDTLDAIARADVRTSRGYGYWNGAGRGEAVSWRDFLAATVENRTEGYYEDWHALFRDSFLERAVFESIYRRMLRLVPLCPEGRSLVHGDLHFDNILGAGERITGVIDWANALYGDPLYDVAWFGRQTAWGAPLIDPALLRARYGALPGYDARIACYECFLGLDDLRFYAKNGRRAPYEAIRAHLLARIDEEPDAP